MSENKIEVSCKWVLSQDGKKMQFKEYAELLTILEAIIQDTKGNIWMRKYFWFPFLFIEIVFVLGL